MQNISNYEIHHFDLGNQKKVTGPKGKKADRNDGLTFLGDTW